MRSSGPDFNVFQILFRPVELHVCLQIARVLQPFEAITKAMSASKHVVLPQMVNLASELYYATLEMYNGADDPSGMASALAALLLENVVKVCSKLRIDHPVHTML